MIKKILETSSNIRIFSSREKTNRKKLPQDNFRRFFLPSFHPPIALALLTIAAVPAALL